MDQNIGSTGENFMKIYLKLLIVFISIFSVIQLPPPRKIYVYFDKASSPSLLQMVDYIHTPKRDIKLIYWERFYSHIQNKNTYQNTFFASSWRNLLDELQQLLKKYPRSKIILHHNLHHDYFFNEFIKHIPKEKILESYAYEDASNYMWWAKGRNYIFYDNPDIKHKLYMWGDDKKFCSGNNPLIHCDEISKLKNYVNIIPVDFHKIANELSKDDIKKLAKLTGIDLKKYQKNLKDKEIGVYLLGFVAGYPLNCHQLIALKDVCSSQKDVTWFYKPHPSNYLTPTKKVLTHFCPNIQKMDAHLPFEFLILSKMTPKYVSGIGSSVFANLTPDSLLSYIARGKNDFYIPTLKKAGLITSETQIYTEETAIKKLEELSIFRVDNNFWFVKINDEYCQFNNDNCYKILLETKDKKVLQNNKKEVFETSLIQNYHWSSLKKVSE